MKSKLVPAAQWGLPALQQRKRDPKTFAPVPKATQTWMCPQCEGIHYDIPVYLTLYHCACGWVGTRIQLLLAEIPDASRQSQHE